MRLWQRRMARWSVIIACNVPSSEGHVSGYDSCLFNETVKSVNVNEKMDHNVHKSFSQSTKQKNISSANLNPLTPRGVRLLGDKAAQERMTISIHSPLAG